MMKKLAPWFLGLVLILAVVARVWQLDRVPDGFTGDEAAFGYLAWAIGEEGMDEYGNRFPLYFESIGDYKYPAYVYLSVPVVKLLGLNVFSTRLLSALAGVGMVWVLFLIVKELFGDKWLAVVSAGMLAISPWHVSFSRGAYEANLGVFLAVVTVWLWLRWLRGGRLSWWEWVGMGLGFGGTMFSYSAIRLFLALFLVVMAVVWKAQNSKAGLKSVIVAGGLVLVTLGLSLSFGSQARAKGLLLLPAVTDRARLFDNIREDGMARGMPLLLTRAFHNKAINYGSQLFDKYISHFDPGFLFVEGDLRPYYKSPSYGLLYAVELPLVLLGLVYLVKKHPGWVWLTVGWVLLAAVPSTITVEERNAVRFLVATPMFALFSAAGILWLIGELKKLKVGVVISGAGIGLVLGWSAIGFGHDQVVHRAYHQPWFRDWGVREMVEKVVERADEYERVVMAGDPYIFFLYFNRVLPSEFLAEAEMAIKEEGQWKRVKAWKNISFGMPVNCPKVGKLDVLYVCKGVEVPINSRVLEVIYYKDGIPAFTFLEFIPLSEVERPKPKLPAMLNYMVEADQRNDGLIPEEESIMYQVL
jgi:hypothetical protein